MKNIIVFEDQLDGHHKTYLIKFNEALLMCGYNVICLAPDKILLNTITNDYHEYKIKKYRSRSVKNDFLFKFFLKIQSYYTNLIIKKSILCFFYRVLRKFNLFFIYLIEQYYLFMSPFWRIIRLFRIKKNIDGIMKNNSIDFVFFPFLGNIQFTISIKFFYSIIDKIFPYSWGGLLIEAGLFHLDKDNFQNDFLLCSMNCKFITTLDPSLDQQFSNLIQKSAYSIPDFIETTLLENASPICYELMLKANKRPIILSIGAMGTRKNLLNLLRALKLSNKNYCVAIIGILYVESFSIEELEEIYHLINELEDNVFFRNYYIKDEGEFNYLINMSDILHIVYKGFSMSSNLLTKAAYFKKPIIASNRFLIGYVTQKYKLGISIDETDVGELASIMNKYSNKKEIKQLGMNAMFNEYYELNSNEKFNSKIKEIFFKHVGQ